MESNLIENQKRNTNYSKSAEKPIQCRVKYELNYEYIEICRGPTLKICVVLIIHIVVK